MKPTGHAICDTCSEIHSERLSLDSLNAQRLAELDAEAELHRDFHIRERAYYDDAVLAGTLSPHLVTCLTIDAPTQHQFDLPSQPRWKRDVAKKLDGTNRWQSKVEGVLDAGVGMLVYLVRQGLGGGPNLVGTVLFLTLMTHVELGRPLGRRLHIQLDNTTAENKNQTFIGCVGLLVAWGIFSEAVIFFMPVGHTYNELDAAFSPLITSLLRVAVATISSLLSFIREFLAGKRVRQVCQLHHLWDFEKLAQTHMHVLGGFARTQQSSGMHEMYFNLDRDGAVRFRARQSSQASTWLPEGEGELLFRSLPSRDDAPPAAAPVKNAAGWRREEVQTNVRRWLPALGLTCNELNAASLEWEKQFALAVDDLDLLPEEYKLVWKPLPVASCGGYSGSMSDAASLSRRDMVENPPVNPIHGAQRKSSHVRAELLEHQGDMRAEAAAENRDPPIYLAEYLLLWVSDSVGGRERRLVLGRVCGVPAGGGTSPTALVDVVEYTHDPQDGYMGFFGVFHARKNPQYDNKTKGSLAFIRRRDVGRDSIVLYNVQTFGSHQNLRIAVRSLRALSNLLPDQQKMPDVLPQTHQDDGDDVVRANSRNCSGSSSTVRRNTDDRKPVVENGAIIEVCWTEDPVGWFRGKVTSSRREGAQWVTRVVYQRCREWPSHAAWHYLDPNDDDAVEWRYAQGQCDAPSDSDSSE